MLTRRHDARRLARAAISALALAVSVVWALQPTMAQQAAEAAPRAVPAARQADRVAVITIRGPINAVTASSVQRRLTIAQADGAQAVVFDIDTPGGEVTAVLEITAAIKASPIVNTVAWINPQAYSGGAIIALACREIVVAESSSFGDALPIAIGLTGAEAATTGELRKKVVPPVLADVVDSARLRGWDEFLVQAIVIDGVELWLIEQRDESTGVVRQLAINEAEFRLLFPDEQPPRGAPMVIAADATSVPAPLSDAPPAAPEDDTAFRPASPGLDSLSPALSGETSADSAQDLDMLATASTRPVLTEADRGRWELVGYLTNGSGPIVMKSREMRELGFSSAVIRSDEELRAFFGATDLVRLDRSWSEAAVRFLSQFWVRGLLIVVFLLAVFLEMTSPGLFLPGIVAAVALVLLMAPAWMLGLAGWWEVLAIVGGILLILIEIFVVPGFGVFGILGLLALFAGLVGSFVSPGGGIFPTSAQAQSELVRGLITVVLAMVTSGAGIGVMIKYFRRLPVLSNLVLDASKVDADDSEDPRELFEAIDDGDALAVLVGSRAVAHSRLMPSGRVEIEGELHDAICSIGFIEQGEAVEVVGVEGWQLVVDRLQGGREQETT
ncbi:MAG: NfeD family protein [Planctomycetota bacterium]